MSCTPFKNLKEEYLFGLLSNEKLEAFEAHMRSCSQCAQSISDLKNKMNGLKKIATKNQPLDVNKIIRKAHQQKVTQVMIVLSIFIVFALAMTFLGIKIGWYKNERYFIDRLEKALFLFKEERGAFPDGTLPLGKVLATFKNPYIDCAQEKRDNQGNFLDRFGNIYHYTFPGKFNPKLFDIYSYGMNSKDEGGQKDDIANWRGKNEI